MKHLPKNLSIVFLVQIVIMVLSHCNGDNPSSKKELDEKVFVQVYCDVLTYSDLIESTLKEAFVDSVLRSYNISREDFQRTVESYSKDESQWEKIISQIVEELERREEELISKSDSTAIEKPIKIE